MSAENALSSIQRDDLRTVAAMIIPASTEYAVPGADDAAVQADVLKTMGRDTEAVCAALDDRLMTNREIPHIRSARIGFRLYAIAEDPI